LTGSDVETRFENRINGAIEFFARLFAFVVFEIELALAEVIFRARDDLCDPSFGLFNFSWDCSR